MSEESEAPKGRWARQIVRLERRHRPEGGEGVIGTGSFKPFGNFTPSSPNAAANATNRPLVTWPTPRRASPADCDPRIA